MLCLARPTSLVLVASLVAASAVGQTRLIAPSGIPSGTAGSVPGSISFQLGTGIVGSPCAVLLSISAGPTPLSIVDPNDPRSLRVGTESLGFSLVGVYLPPNNNFVTPAVPTANASFIGRTLYFQGVDFPGSGSPGFLVNNISNGVAIRFAAANSFLSAATLTLARSFAEPLENADGSITLAGGGQGPVLAQVTTDTIERFDPVTRTWTMPITVMSAARSLYRAQKLDDGRYLLAGGLGLGQVAQASAETYDPVTEQFAPVASMSTPRAAYRRIKRPDGTVIVMGGFTHTTIGTIATILTSATNTTEIYDPVTNTWSPGPNMAVPRATFETVDLGGGKHLVAGGVGPFVHPTFGVIPLVYPVCEIYDEVANTFTPTNSMNVPRAAFGAHKVGNSVLVNGGGDLIDQANPNGRVTKTAEVYDIATGQWTMTNSMATERAFHFSFDAAGGNAIAVGGANGDLIVLNPLASTEIWDPATGLWTPGPNIPVATNAYGPWESPQGELFLFGGATTGAAALDTTSVYYR